MDKRTILAISLSFLIFMGWQKFYIEPRLPKPSASPAAIATGGTPPSISNTSAPSSAKTSAPSVSIPSEEISFQTTVATGKISNGKKFFSDFELGKFTDSHLAPGTKVKMPSVTPGIPAQIELAFDASEYAYLNGVSGRFSKEGDQTIWTFEDERVKLKRIFSFDSKLPYVNVQLSAVFKSVAPQSAFLSLESTFPQNDPEEQDRQLLAYSMGSLERKHHKDVKAVEDIPGPIEWIGAQNRYFLLSLVPAKSDGRALLQTAGTEGARLSLVFPVSGKEWSENVKVYFGPKEVDTLNAISPTLSQTVDFGIFGLFANPILVFMRWLHSILGNWGLAIIVLTLAIKVATFPLTYKSMKSMKSMAKMQPELEKIRAKHKDDKEALNRELMTFMREKGYNPVSGCLPILIQMPVFFALYRVLYSSIELYQSPFYFWIHDLSVKDGFYITPVILTGVMWLQQKLTPNTITDPMQAKMMQYMPLLFGFMMINLPAGLTIYMLVNALASIAQQLYINRKLDRPMVEVVSA
jgi:YidC/Oxa1 family membrane protein insertase